MLPFAPIASVLIEPGASTEALGCFAHVGAARLSRMSGTYWVPYDVGAWTADRSVMLARTL